VSEIFLLFEQEMNFLGTRIFSRLRWKKGIMESWNDGMLMPGFSRISDIPLFPSAVKPQPISYEIAF